eukprot:485195-Pleurochrysis_carterae.AAC.4
MRSGGARRERGRTETRTTKLVTTCGAQQLNAPQQRGACRSTSDLRIEANVLCLVLSRWNERAKCDPSAGNRLLSKRILPRVRTRKLDKDVSANHRKPIRRPKPKRDAQCASGVVRLLGRARTQVSASVSRARRHLAAKEAHRERVVGEHLDAELVAALDRCERALRRTRDAPPLRTAQSRERSAHGVRRTRVREPVCAENVMTLAREPDAAPPARAPVFGRGG